MPGYGKRSMYATPEPTEEVETLDKRFTMSSPILLILVAGIIAYAWNVRKMNGAVVTTLALAIGLLHVYEHLYRVERGPEKFRYF